LEETVTFKVIATRRLVEHPANRGLFRDIKETNPAFWLEFVDSIKTFGIIEPLIVNKETMQVRSGNQRLKAAVEIGLEEVPVVLVDPDTDSDEEIRKMIASNVFRRTIDPFAMFEYIGRLRNPSRDGKSVAKESVAHSVHKKRQFVDAADIFSKLPEEQQTALREWFNEQAEGQKAKTEGELIAMVRELEADNTALEAELRGVNSDQKTVEERVAELQAMLDERDIQLAELRDADTEQEIAERDAEINKLLEQQKKLKDKIKELNETPDINFYLIECVKKQNEINKVLNQIVENADALNPAKVAELQAALKRTFQIIQKGSNKNGQNDRRELISD
jgi:hypothetical protein